MMHKRIQEGRGLRYWDDLFAAIFRRHASINMSVENTDKGVRVKETSTTELSSLSFRLTLMLLASSWLADLRGPRESPCAPSGDGETTSLI